MVECLWSGFCRWGKGGVVSGVELLLSGRWGARSRCLVVVIAAWVVRSAWACGGVTEAAPRCSSPSLLPVINSGTVVPSLRPVVVLGLVWLGGDSELPCGRCGWWLWSCVGECGNV